MVNIVLALTTIFTGLFTGLLYGVAVTVNKGLSAVKNDRIYITSHNSINRAINPLNSLILVPPVLLIVSSVLVYSDSGDSNIFWLTLIATVLYFIGVLGITVVRNIPLFTGLWKVDPEKASEQELAEKRVWHERPWHFWHNLRTVISLIVFSITVIALLI